MSDDDDRTTAFGLFNYAHSYWQSATKLHFVKVRASHPDSPVLFLYCHAVELYLKAYLRAHGVSAAQLRKSYGHNLIRLAAGARRNGLQFDDEDVAVVRLIPRLDTTARYIRTGQFTRPGFEALDRFHASVGHFLKAKGLPVRLQPKWREPAP